jgi:hypothetical protein
MLLYPHIPKAWFMSALVIRIVIVDDLEAGMLSS